MWYIRRVLSRPACHGLQRRLWSRSLSLTARAASESQKADPAVPYKTYKADDVQTELPSQVDVVVVGGGVIGCTTAYHLSRMGAGRVVLLEKDQLTAGTTWHTAGLVWSLRPSDTEVCLLNRSKALMQSLEAETGVNTGWINNGGLFVAKDKVRLDEYKRLHTLGKAFGVESFVLTPEETKTLYPLMNVSDICGSLYSPQDGTIDPAGYCTALTRGAKKNGAQIVQDCTVSDIQTYTDDFGTKRVKAVETNKGTIKTDVIVNAAGVWSPYIGAMAGVSVPLVVMRHAYVVTERIEGIQNMPNMRDHDASVYAKLQGDALSVGGYEPNPIFIDKVSKDFAFSLYDLDWDVFSFNIEGAINRIPVIETTGVKSTVCGPESFTPDHRPLLGESPEVRGFYLACGMNSGGMMNSWVAEQVAHWVLHGRPELDMYGYDIRRFTTKLTDNFKWCKERSHEAYAKNYSIVFPHDEPLASRNMRQDALYQDLLEAGCVYQERQGWERPGWYSDGQPSPALPYDFYGYYGNKANTENPYFTKLKNDYTFDFPNHHDKIGSECLSCRNSSAVFNMSYFGKYYLTGPDASKAADWIFTNDMQKPPGTTIYTCILNKAGGTELDLTVSVVESGAGGPHSPKLDGRGYYLAVGGGVAQHAYSYIQDIIQDNRWNCSILDHSDDMCIISVQGPQSRAVLQSICGDDLSDESFPYGTNKVISIAGSEARALRVSFVGELGWELHVPNSAAVATYRAIMEAGKSRGIANGGYRALDSLSLEKGYRLWHTDLRADDSPHEALLGFTCKLSGDTPFLGREALVQRKQGGLNKRLVFFTLDDHVPLFGNEVIWRNDEVVGYLRRADYAFYLDKSIGCGYVGRSGRTVSPDWIKEGVYSLESKGVKHPAMCHLRSQFDPENKRVKGIYA